MELILDKKNFLEALVFCKKNSGKTQGNNVHIVELNARKEKFILRSSSDTQSVTISLDVSDCKKEGSALIDLDKLLSILKASSGSEVKLKRSSNGKLLLQVKESRFNLLETTMPFIFIDHLEDLDVKNVDLGDSLQKASLCIEPSSTNNSLGYVWISNNYVAASNAFVIFTEKIEEDLGIRACLPLSSVRDVKGSVSFKINNSQIDLIQESSVVSIRLNVFKIPPFEQILKLDESTARIKLNSSNLKQSVDLFSSLLPGAPAIDLVFTSNKIKIKMSNGSEDYGENVLDCESNIKDELSIAFNPKNLSICLNALAATNILLKINNNETKQPIHFMNEDNENRICLLSRILK